MKTKERNCYLASFVGLVLLMAGVTLQASATDRFVSPAGGNVPPYLDWSSAATNIQDAVDAASTGDTVWVTNGVYRSGGRPLLSGMTNRVLINTALTLQSVNGPEQTVIQGAWDTATNGYSAVRCVWASNGVVISGFTLRGGSTRPYNASADTCGAGLYAGTSVIVSNCWFLNNVAGAAGGGASQGSLLNCILDGNGVLGSGPGGITMYQGGGAYYCNLTNCTLIRNWANGGGGAAANCFLRNCALVKNWAASAGGAVLSGGLANCTVVANSTGYHFFTPGGAVADSTLVNTLVYNNSAAYTGYTNYNNHCVISYSDSLPLPAGTGNINADPQLLFDNIHLSASSPCRGAGDSNSVFGTDIDGQPWTNRPSIGCDEWYPAPLITAQPQLQVTNFGTVTLTGFSVAGQPPFTFTWLKDGAVLTDDSHYGLNTSTLGIRGFTLADAGGYQLVATNSFGACTSAVFNVAVHCVNLLNSTPNPPYLDWTSAATNIQNAIDAASPGDVVLVTNGTYATGGRYIGFGPTNRIVLTNSVLVQSINGPASTLIQGAWSKAATNGFDAVRCAFVSDGSTLSGFTLQGGATRSYVNDPANSSGGGVCGSSTNANVFNCIITGNCGFHSGGGASYCTLRNCVLNYNTTFCADSIASGGGGTYLANVINSVVAYNQALVYPPSISVPGAGGGCFGGNLLNCTIRNNTAAGSLPYQGKGGGIYSATARNCIICSNDTSSFAPVNFDSFSSMLYCDTTPLPSGIGNITADPQLVGDGFHITSSSPCRNAGTNIDVGTDLDGQPWNPRPSIGCDEWQPQPVISSQPVLAVGTTPDCLTIGAGVAGQTPFACYWQKDGVAISDGTRYSQSGTANLVISGFSPSDSGAYQVVASNSFGMVTSQIAQVTVHCVDVSSGAPASPFLSWQTAATNIQDAIDVAGAGDVVLVADGIYSNGGRVVAGDLTNRVAITKPIVVMSLHGAASTTIQGAWDPISTNGPGAIRCAWLTNGAILNGFTVQGGATRLTNSISSLLSGGGVYCSGSVANCIITGNSASYGGGGGCFGIFKNCIFAGNSARYGGAVQNSALYNCFIEGNFATAQGGGVYLGSIANCTIVSNSCAGNGGGISSGTTGAPLILNSIIYFNSAASNANVLYALSTNGTWTPPAYCCTTPLPPGPGNISADPQLLDGFHIAGTSPCRRAGTTLYCQGVDLDGEPWTNPPSIGCDEVGDANLTGPLSVTVVPAWTTVAQGHSMPLYGQLTGRASKVRWDFGDSSTLTDTGLTTSHIWTNVGDYVVTLSAVNADNPSGVAATTTAHVVPLLQPSISAVSSTLGTFNLSFPGQPGVAYLVEQTTNLAWPISWQPLTNVFSTGDVMHVYDLQATNTSKFYRLHSN